MAMEDKEKEIWAKMRDHGHSPDAQAQNLAELAAFVLEKQNPPPKKGKAEAE